MEEIYNIFKSKEQFQGGYMRFLKKDLKTEIARGTYFYEDGVYLSWLVKKDCINIKKFVSEKENEGKGSRIFRKFLSKYPNEKKILKVKKNNLKAIAFYKRFSFLEVESDDKFLVMDWKPEYKKIYKYMPVSVFDVAGVGKKGIRGYHHQGDGTSSRSRYSPFNPDVCELIVEFFLENKNVILDLFAGWGTRASICNKYNKVYYGIDISPTAIEYAQKTYGVTNILGDSRTEPIIEHDGAILCPPYYNLEKYDGEKNLSNLKTWEEFLKDYELIYKRAIEKALPGAIYCIVVGDWRANKVYYNLSYETQRIMKKLGMKIKDKVILNQKKTTNYRMYLPQSKRLGYTAKVHQYLLVFEKPGSSDAQVKSKIS